MFKIDDDVLFVDPDKDKPQHGKVCGCMVNETGFDVVEIKNDNGKFIVTNTCFVFAPDQFEAADSKRKQVQALNAEIKAIQDESNHKISFLLEQMKGKPKYTHLTLRPERITAHDNTTKGN